MRLTDRIEEVQTELNNNMGCIIFDLSCYFPYIEQDKLTIDFSIGLEKCDDIKLNHRYHIQFPKFWRKYFHTFLFDLYTH